MPLYIIALDMVSRVHIRGWSAKNRYAKYSVICIGNITIPNGVPGLLGHHLGCIDGGLGSCASQKLPFGGVHSHCRRPPPSPLPLPSPQHPKWFKWEAPKEAADFRVPFSLLRSCTPPSLALAKNASLPSAMASAQPIGNLPKVV